MITLLRFPEPFLRRRRSSGDEMSNTEQQLSESLTAFFVAYRTLIEAELNRVTTIVSQSQVKAFELTDEVRAVQADIKTIRADMAHLAESIAALADALNGDQERAA